MTSEQIADLTDKEKEALRLLLAGHDAKSSAIELDISVHTVNDRLRNARRKLGVSSSREAARILGDAEGATPQYTAHASFGIPISGAETDNADLTNQQPRGPFGLTWFAGGMLIMSVLIAAAIVGVVYLGDGGTTASHPPAQAGSETAAKASADDPVALGRAEEFLKYVDAGDWQGSWEAAGAYFQSQASAEEWASVVDPVRTPLGKVVERRLATVQRASTVPGAPEGDYQFLQFQTEFTGREGIVVETVVMLWGQDGWKVVGYFVNTHANSPQ